MNARIVAITGAHKGLVWELSEDEFSVGRDLTNSLSLYDPSVSRHHCVIRREGELFMIRDLGSHNGTIVNDIPVTERLLQQGDYIKVGGALFRFLSGGADDAPVSDIVQFAGEDMLTMSTVKFRLAEATSTMSRDLSVLMKISTSINRVHGLENVKKELLRLIFEAVPAQSGAILVGGGAQDIEASAFGLSRDSEQLHPIKLSRTVVQEVLQKGVSIIGNGIADSARSMTAESLAALKSRSLLCIPLLLRSEVKGLIYLDTSDSDVSFDEHHLSLMTAISGIASLALDNAQRMDWLENENERLRSEISIESSMVGTSKPMQDIYQFIAKVARGPSNVLVRGESGTGKELVARAIHMNSPRASNPFVPINCATLSEELLESELFGHEKGAFTGAVAQKKGKLEVAMGGTVFLDEVGEIAQSLQAKLLRVLQEHKMDRVGGIQPIELDIRLITATNRNLEEAISDGTFRRDLYYRLNVISCTMPRLRDRREDIPALARHFIAKHSARCNRRVTGISQETLEHLISYDWPGNVRELENVIERAIVLGTTEVIALDDLPEDVLSSRLSQDTPAPGLYEALRDTKRQMILKVLEQTKYNYAEAAELLKIHPNNLHRLIRSMDLKVPTKRN
jgi:transcriptional regulator with GAF, ATPase, and Fis domain